jgi:hypothetical protein
VQTVRVTIPLWLLWLVSIPATALLLYVLFAFAAIAWANWIFRKPW